MAVFTKLEKKDIENFLEDYSIGSLISFEGIVEGIENTNYKIKTSKHEYILTIFEKRVKPADLPFFMKLQKDLAANGFDCPVPIENNMGSSINNLKDKSAVIISFLDGKQLQLVQPHHCREVGSMIGRFTNITKSSKLIKENSMNIDAWENILIKCKKHSSSFNYIYLETLEKELSFLKKNWPKNLPTAIIHSDLFKDNIFFIEDKISGIIDFYFSCNDFIAYEIALTINAWCFDLTHGFQLKNYLSLIDGFNEHSSLNNDEMKALNILLRGASVRIIVTRLHDKIFQQEDALVIPKDPKEYLNILEWHQKNNIIDL